MIDYFTQPNNYSTCLFFHEHNFLHAKVTSISDVINFWYIYIYIFGSGSLSIISLKNLTLGRHTYWNISSVCIMRALGRLGLIQALGQLNLKMMNGVAMLQCRLLELHSKAGTASI